MASPWWFPWKAGTGTPAPVNSASPSGAYYSHGNLGWSLLLSLLLHAAVMALQFGEYGSGLPWFGLPGASRITSIPTLSAILRSELPAETPAPQEFTQHLLGQHTVSSGPPHPRRPAPPRLTAANEPAIASIGETRVALPSEEAGEKRRIAEPVTEARKTDVAEGGIAVLSTESESTWSKHIAKTTVEEEKARNDQLIKQQAEEAQAVAQKMREDQAQILAERAEKAQQAAIAKAREDALTRQRAEEQARIEAERAKQAAELKAREEMLAKRAEEEALARKRQIEAAKLAERAAAEKSLAAERSLARAPSTVAGKQEGGREDGSGQSADKGSDLASRAMDMARTAPSGFPAREPADLSRSRRGTILGRDPKDIQLAFYGESWRQKVERIGSMNYPRLSRNLVYDPLVVTVSINSDGTLAGLRIVRSSGHKELDEAVRRIVEMSAPFSAFPPDLKRSFDVVDITRTWTFFEERPRISSQ